MSVSREDSDILVVFFLLITYLRKLQADRAVQLLATSLLVGLGLWGKENRPRLQFGIVNEFNKSFYFVKLR